MINMIIVDFKSGRVMKRICCHLVAPSDAGHINDGGIADPLPDIHKKQDIRPFSRIIIPVDLGKAQAGKYTVKKTGFSAQKSITDIGTNNPGKQIGEQKNCLEKFCFRPVPKLTEHNACCNSRNRTDNNKY